MLTALDLLWSDARGFWRPVGGQAPLWGDDNFLTLSIQNVEKKYGAAVTFLCVYFQLHQIYLPIVAPDIVND